MNYGETFLNILGLNALAGFLCWAGVFIQLTQRRRRLVKNQPLTTPNIQGFVGTAILYGVIIVENVPLCDNVVYIPIKFHFEIIVA